MFTVLMDKNKQLNDAVESWGANTLESPYALAADESRACVGSLFSGICSQDHFLPINYCPITCEF